MKSRTPTKQVGLDTASPVVPVVPFRFKLLRQVRSRAALLLVVTASIFALLPANASALAIGADSNPSGNPGDFHVWVIASDHDLIQVGMREAITTACKAKA